jgi:putative ABC transport system ATP-binding protein
VGEADLEPEEPFALPGASSMIELAHIVKEYINGKEVTRVLKDVSFSVKKGEFVAIMGPSGSGKSTLMHIIGALDTPTAGEYRLDGQSVSSLSADQLASIRRAKIGFVFQSFHLLPRATVLRNVALPLVYAKIARREREVRARAALLAAGLDESHHLHLSNQLSGGQMQRVAIARALVNDPAIVLADEPTGNLDSKTGDLVLGTFQKLHAQGRTIVLITHEPYVAEHAERVLIVKDGVLIEDRLNKTRRLQPEL